jgi:hypothetical protein
MGAKPTLYPVERERRPRPRRTPALFYARTSGNTPNAPSTSFAQQALHQAVKRSSAPRRPHLAGPGVPGGVLGSPPLRLPLCRPSWRPSHGRGRLGGRVPPRRGDPLRGTSALFLFPSGQTALCFRVAGVGATPGDIQRTHQIFGGGVLGLFIGYGEPWRHQAKVRVPNNRVTDTSATAPDLGNENVCCGLH